MDALSAADITAAIAEISDVMTRNRERLITLDGQIGDGDLGLTMAKGFAAASDEVARATEGDVGRLLMKAGMAIARSAPSTMGTLIASGFMAGGKAVSGSSSLDLGGLAVFLKAFVEGIMLRGKAKPGEKTGVDVFYPASESIAKAASEGLSLREGVERCYAAGGEGLQRTRDMIAQHGRPAYYGEQSRGKEDPGATAGLLILEGLRDWVAGRG